MKKKILFIYGIFSYLLFLVVFIYLIGFLANAVVPKSIDSGTVQSFSHSIIINFGLITLFAIQHTIMARRQFKKWWIKIIPKAIERSTFVLVTSLVLILIMWLWQPIPQLVWNVTSQPANILLWAIFAFGWLFLFLSTRQINDRHLFGVQQVYENLKGKKLSDPEFQIPAFYRFTRHPMMLGFIIAFWATPQMSIGHLLFASLNTLYIFIGIQFEEKDLHHFFGQKYKKYSEQVSMLIPFKIADSSKEKHLVNEEDK